MGLLFLSLVAIVTWGLVLIVDFLIEKRKNKTTKDVWRKSTTKNTKDRIGDWLCFTGTVLGISLILTILLTHIAPVNYEYHETLDLVLYEQGNSEKYGENNKGNIKFKINKGYTKEIINTYGNHYVDVLKNGDNRPRVDIYIIKNKEGLWRWLLGEVYCSPFKKGQNYYYLRVPKNVNSIYSH